MKLSIDKNHLLVIENSNIPQTKEYTYNVSGYIFSDFDKGIIVLHKKERKIINLKNLGDNMAVVYITDREYIQAPFDAESFINGLCLFDSFDEETGKTYYFIPKFAEKEIGPINKKLEKLGIQAIIEKTEKGCIIKNNIQPKNLTGNHTSFLFALILLYGKMEIKNDELVAVKIHIPLFGQFLKYEEIFATIKQQLAEEGIFIGTSSQTTNDGIVYQISCNDYELLKIFAEYAKGIEKIDKITKEDQALEYKQSLIEFLQNNPDIPTEGKAEVLQKLQEGTMKLLMK